MGKMKGNRLNTAANVGTFVTSRQQLAVQRELLEQGEIQTEYAMMSINKMKREQLEDELSVIRERGAREIAAGRLTEDALLERVETHRYNFWADSPTPNERVVSGFWPNVGKLLNIGGTPPGWYEVEGEGPVRYWDGEEWTLLTTSIQRAQSLVKSGSSTPTLHVLTAPREPARDAPILQLEDETWPARGEETGSQVGYAADRPVETSSGSYVQESSDPFHQRVLSPTDTALPSRSSMRKTGTSSKSFTVTWVLALFGGIFGLDRFYLGKQATGLVKALVSLLGILTIVGWMVWPTIDLIITLVGKQSDFHGKPLKGYENGRVLAWIVTPFAVAVIVTLWIIWVASIAS